MALIKPPPFADSLDLLSDDKRSEWASMISAGEHPTVGWWKATGIFVPVVHRWGGTAIDFEPYGELL